MSTGKVAVDFDRTLATHRDGQEELGKPILPMLNRVKRWVDEGHDVWIFTARGGDEGQRRLIQDWLVENGLPRLPVTNIKRPDFVRFYDDKAVSVSPNGGTILTERRSSHRLKYSRK